MCHFVSHIYENKTLSGGGGGGGGGGAGVSIASSRSI